VLLKIKGAKRIRPDFFIEIVESKMIENIVLVQQIIGFFLFIHRIRKILR